MKTIEQLLAEALKRIETLEKNQVILERRIRTLEVEQRRIKANVNRNAAGVSALDVKLRHRES
jgi:hypothetical protein